MTERYRRKAPERAAPLRNVALAWSVPGEFTELVVTLPKAAPIS